MQYNNSSFYHSKNGWHYYANASCFSWYRWDEKIDRAIYPCAASLDLSLADIDTYLIAISNDLPDGLSFHAILPDKLKDGQQYKNYWEEEGSQLVIFDVQFSGKGQQKEYGLALMTMLRYLREKPEIATLFARHYDQWPKHWDTLGILLYIQQEMKQVAPSPSGQYGHGLMERQCKSFCRNWEEFEFRRVGHQSSSNQITRSTHGGSASAKEITFKLDQSNMQFRNQEGGHTPAFKARTFPEFGIDTKVSHSGY